MDRTIYFVRHSIRDIRIKEDESALLTELGKQYAMQMSEFFQYKNIHHILSSPYKRTIDTIKPTAEQLNLKIKEIEPFKERIIGEWVENFDEFSLRQWSQTDYKLPNGESLEDVRNRIVPSYQKVLSHYEGNLIITGHGTALAVLFNELTGSFTYEDWKNMKMPDIYQLDYDHQNNISFKKVEMNF
ncbi:histidine phosphatase family protein [Mammaliicoccus sciuri]|uniref:histidine phosphatase family protein n=1 Tax=Mammaliicoccus sciuri TaxID=1296 RepID=UPI00191449A8|nr:histidine phosphatase family protein [Mammaliicoccus sciuri]